MSGSTKPVVAVIEARMGSSRLPGKSMRPLAGIPLVERVVARARRCRTVDQVVVATSVSPADDILASHLERRGITVFRGSENDLLGRILGAAEAAGATVHVQCWGDCPLLEASEVDRVVAELLANDWDLVGNNFSETRQLAYGLDVIAFKVEALRRADIETRSDPYHREHGTTYIYQTPGAFNITCMPAPPDLCFPEFNATINTADDLAFMEKLHELLGDASFDVRDAMALIRRTPELLSHPNAKGLRTPA